MDVRFPQARRRHIEGTVWQNLANAALGCIALSSPSPVFVKTHQDDLERNGDNEGT